jgi:hypothetical protein
MKTKTLLVTALLIISSRSFATVRTVSNDPIGGSQYNTLIAAYNASSANDTLLIEGTDIAYFVNTTKWDKKLIVIGIGFNPQKQNARRTFFTQFSDVSGVFSLNSGASGSRFYGITFDYKVRFEQNVSDLAFEDCQIEEFQFNGKTAYNIAFRNCHFNSDANNNLSFSGDPISNTGILISNCIFDGYISGNSNSALSAVIDHCLFLNPSGNIVLNNCLNFSIINSIFMNRNPIQTGGTSGTTFKNCLARLGGLPSGSGNINAVDPNFTNYTVGNYHSYTYDYRLKTGSAAIGAATDSTDIGLHGGSAKFNESGEVLITPIIRSMIIQNSFVAPKGTLRIQLNATKPNDK